MPFKPEVRVGNDPKFYGNALTFQTPEEAHHYVNDLACRWTAVVDTRVVESDEPVNYKFVDNELISLTP